MKSLNSAADPVLSRNEIGGYGPTSLGLADYPQVDTLGSWYKSVNFGAETHLAVLFLS